MKGASAGLKLCESSPGTRMYAEGFEDASAKNAFVSGDFVTWAGVRPAWLMRVKLVAKFAMNSAYKFLQKMSLTMTGRYTEAYRILHRSVTALRHQKSEHFCVIIPRSNMEWRAHFLRGQKMSRIAKRKRDGKEIRLSHIIPCKFDHTII
jgi:hypothetical protein